MTTTLPVPPPVAPDRPAPPPARRTADPVWVRPALLALLLATAVLYLWGLSRNGWANSFYSAAVQAGSASWKAFFFGSSDAANSITVDKTPAALWVMALSARVFGVNAWSILVPQALMGVASVGLLFATVRRWYGPAAGLIAGAVLATTPIAVLMFRFNNPDALLVLLMVAAAYATVRAIENGSTKWIMLAGVFVGFGFLAKMLQALLVVPAFALAYLVAGPPKLGKRIGQLLLSGVALVVSAGWYIAIVELVPASMRPYIGGSQNNSILELTLGYNGLGRLNGDETGSVGGGGGAGGGMWGSTGLLRMVESAQGGQISWLLPAALILLVVGLVVTARRARTDRQRAGLLVWGGWLLITGLVFSFMQGIFHAYYTVALAPAIGAVAGMGVALLWRRGLLGAVTLAATVAVTAWWSYHLLARSADFLPWLRWVVLIGGLVGAVALLGALRLPARVAALAAGVSLAAVLAGPSAYAVQTAAEVHTGSIPSAGPAVAGGFGGGPGRGGFGGNRGGFPGGGFPGGGQGGLPGGGFPGGTNQNGGTGQNGTAQGGNAQGGTAQGGTAQGGRFGGRGTGGGMRGGGGGLLDAATVSDEMKALLEADADQYTWAAAAVGSQSASGYQLATGDPVMAVGGFNGSDPSPTLAQFQQYVAHGQIHYFIAGGGFGGGRSMGGSSASSEIATWVSENFTARTVGTTTVYDLTQPTSSTTA
ncbi:glycosyltransferase family 39 protein [Paractinoplanes maris]|uniref:glycosyltransferase family 39 protein n=1 Tax=Paractinoplanes maris TaxID=1734446 RepID=UPI00202195C8|nr:glycosyltransferase family 39 protein [Actinoplanes maris]